MLSRYRTRYWSPLLLQSPPEGESPKHACGEPLNAKDTIVLCASGMAASLVIQVRLRGLRSPSIRRGVHSTRRHDRHKRAATAAAYS